MAEMSDDDEPHAAKEELYHTNLLRLQAQQLLDESVLNLSSSTGYLEKEVKWASEASEYIDVIRRTIGGVKGAILSPDDVRVKKSSKGKQKHLFLTELHSDKARRHMSGEEKDAWSIPFEGGATLDIAPIYSYAANGAGLTTKAANANVTPTIDLAVLLPVIKDEDEERNGMIGGKDYLNGRYFDVSLDLNTLTC
jgi:hypothetical protein